MSSIVNKEYTLVLNSMYMPIGVTPIKKALIAMNSAKLGESLVAAALNLEYKEMDNGEINFSSPSTYYPVSWEDWIQLPVRSFDIPIHTPKMIIRAPIVLVARNCDKIPMKRIPLSKRAVYNHYKGRCIWSGEKLSLNEASLEHMITRSAKGARSWKNIGLAHKKLNAERGNTPLEKWKYKAKYPLSEPLSRPVSTMITTAVRPEWEYFLIVKK